MVHRDPGGAPRILELVSDQTILNDGRITRGDEFRTAPLWGLGQRIFFLHDGRTSNLLTAIQLNFLRSL